MSAVHDSHGHAHHDDHAHHPSGVMRWITTTNHKDIGTLYLWFSFAMFIVGGLLALGIRAELFVPSSIS
jgi:cytochrome c oxidase subunit 1